MATKVTLLLLYSIAFVNCIHFNVFINKNLSETRVEVKGDFERTVTLEEANVYGINKATLLNITDTSYFDGPVAVSFNEFDRAKVEPVKVKIAAGKPKVINFKEDIVAVTSNGYVNINDSVLDAISDTQCVYNNISHKWKSSGIIPDIGVFYNIYLEGHVIRYTNRYSRDSKQTGKYIVGDGLKQRVSQGEILVTTLYCKRILIEIEIPYHSYLHGEFSVYEKDNDYLEELDLEDAMRKANLPMYKYSREILKLELYTKAGIKSKKFKIQKMPYVRKL